jgi:hypothetical protein
MILACDQAIQFPRRQAVVVQFGSRAFVPFTWEILRYA